MAESEKYILGLDAGNTVIKAVLFNLQGKVISVHALDGQSSQSKPGYVERDINELWRNSKEVIRACISSAGIEAKDILAIGCAGHGNGLYLLDGDDLPILGIQSLDMRAAELVENLNQDPNVNEIHSICLQKPWPSQTPCLLAWIKENKADIYDNIGTVMLCKDLITYSLTGEKVSDISDMSGCGLLSMHTLSYDDNLLKLYGLRDAKNMLPRLVSPHELAGHVNEEAAAETGLIVGTPVVGGVFDAIASALGSGVVRPGDVSTIVGTWSVNQVFSNRIKSDPNLFMVSACSEELFSIIESSATSAANLEWYVREFVERGIHHEDPFGYCNDEAAKVTPKIDDPIFHPFLYGSGQGAEMRGGFYGLAGWHGEKHMIRAILEGVAFEHRRHVEKLSIDNETISQIVLSGGGARSPIWPQIFADCLGKKISVSSCEETGALGAAIVAARGIEIFSNLEDAVDNMTKQKATYAPNPKMQAHYDRRFELYTELTGSLSSFWHKLKKSDQV